jgi:hypothetical protein
MYLVVESEWLEQVDRGADNPRLNIPTCHETRKGGQGPTLGCNANDDDDDDLLLKQVVHTVTTGI